MKKRSPKAVVAGVADAKTQHFKFIAPKLRGSATSPRQGLCMWDMLAGGNAGVDAEKSGACIADGC
ncbi:hypothetical protein [Comamonas sp. GB3 AK4-5]|uniref:hypothetical protein n=1 Tax=Comamonas sp. GB3 AK4-5 TaxID=3231487 RepID=UPI00351ED0A6